MGFKIFVDGLVGTIDHIHGEIDDVAHELGSSGYFGPFAPFGFETISAFGLKSGWVMELVFGHQTGTV